MPTVIENNITTKMVIEHGADRGSSTLGPFRNDLTPTEFGNLANAINRFQDRPIAKLVKKVESELTV